MTQSAPQGPGLTPPCAHKPPSPTPSTPKNAMWLNEQRNEITHLTLFPTQTTRVLLCLTMMPKGERCHHLKQEEGKSQPTSTK